MRFHFTSASIVAIIGALVAVAVSFGIHMTQSNIDAILTLVGLIGAGITIGGGAKSAALIREGSTVDGLSYHFSPALLVSLVGAVIAVAVSFGVHMTQENIDSILKLVGLIAGGMLVGGGVKSGAMITSGVHPAYEPPARAPSHRSTHRRSGPSDS